MQSVQRLWGEKFIKVWYNKSHAAGRFPYNDKNEGMHMANGIIFLVGALIMFYMALRSVRQRRSLCTNGEKVQARITGTVQSRDGTAYVLEFTTEDGQTQAFETLHYETTPISLKSVDAGATPIAFAAPEQ